MGDVFLGMRGTGDWGTDVRPKSFREGILYLFPNGDTPLMAITAMGRSERVNDPEFAWWTKNLETQAGALISAYVYTDPTFSTPHAGGSGTAGDIVYLKTSAVVAGHFRAGHTAVIALSTASSTYAYGKVTAIQINGNLSRITFKLLVDVDASILDVLDFVDITGNVNAEGAPIPDAISYDPVKFTNFTQIFRTALDITRTAKKTRLRTGNAKAELQRETLQTHGVEMEQQFMFGDKSENTGSNGKPERTTQGMVPFIVANADSNRVSNYPAANSGLSWRTAGEDWFDDQLEILFRVGGSEPIAFCGNGALRGIQKIAKASGEFKLEAETAAYGVKIVRWTTPFGDVLLKRHPLFTHKTIRHNDMTFFRPENLRFRFIDDTIYKKDTGLQEGGATALDGEKDEYLTEAGFEFYHPNTFMHLTGVGLDG